MKRRVVITGIGAISPLGLSAEETWERIISGQSGIDFVKCVQDDTIPVKVAAEVDGFELEKYMGTNRKRKKMDRFTEFAVAASIMALNDSKLIIDQSNAERVGVWIGSGIGGTLTFEKECQNLFENGTRKISPILVPTIIPDMASGQVSIAIGAKGINNCSVTACASGANSIGDSFRAIQYGDVDIMISGGSEASISRMALASFSNMNAISKNPDPYKASRPFDKNRDGFVLGEGAGIIVLEELEHALQRNAPIYAEIVGYGSTGDAYHFTTPAPGGEGAVRAMKLALQNAGLQPEQIDYINAHGTSTYYNDLYETQAIKTLFGDYAFSIPISSTKSMTGHLMGATGALEAIFAVKTIQDGIIPPTINYECPDENLDLDYVPNKARKSKVKAVLSNSLGFGGHNATLIFKKFEL